MKILLTGASSFSGFWFARALHGAGHHVVAALRGSEGSYREGVRAERVRKLSDYCEIAWDRTFGDSGFLDLAESGAWDVLCHHAARVGDYRSPDFDVPGAVAENTRCLAQLLKRMSGLKAIVLTGSVFENDEGAGNAPLRAFSPYGLSKALSFQVFRYWCDLTGMPLAKFLIPNPFGPFEEPRFGAYLMRSFFEDKPVEVKTPLYVRDNIHVDLLAACYAKFVTDAETSRGISTCHPSGYVEAQGAFSQRFGDEMRKRMNRPCVVTLGVQTDFSEPMTRINTDAATTMVPGWNEAAAWDDILTFYQATLRAQGVKNAG